MTTVSPFSGSPSSIQTDTQMASSTNNANITVVAAKPTTKPKAKPRKRANNAEKRNQHNAIERARREVLNAKFYSLARLIPALASAPRASKSAIVNGSISHLKYSREQRLIAARKLREGKSAYDELLAEVNQWRHNSGRAPKVSALPWDAEMEQICSVESETFGSFAEAEGEGDVDAEEDEESNEYPEQAMFSTLTGMTGLVTPRSSTDMGKSTGTQVMFNGMPVVQETSSPSATVSATTASINGLSWSHDFAFGINGSNVSLPFLPSANESPNHSNSASTSPATSNQGVFTPPSIDGVYQPTVVQGSSPHSVPSTTSAMNDKPAAVVVPSQSHPPAQAPPNAQWAQQMIMMQAQAQQAHQQARMQAQQASRPFTNTNSFQPALHNLFLQHPQQHQQQQVPAQSAYPSSANTNANANTPNFTQQMLQQMFAQQQMRGPVAQSNHNQPPVQEIERWRAMALNNCGPVPHASVADVKANLNAGIAMGMSMWQDNQVEGF